MTSLHARERRSRVIWLSGLFCMCTGVGAWAAPGPDQITVYGQRWTRTAPGVEAARLQAARVPGGTNVIGRDEYADGRASNLLDVFALTTGVFVQPRFGAEESRLSIRGSGLQRTFHMRGIHLLQDGVPITLADGSGDFQAVEPLSLAYTEVMRGGNALQYGGTTLGGSVNFVSPSGEDGGGLRSRAEVGSFGYVRALASSGSRSHSRDGFISLSAYEQEGFRAWSRQNNQRLFGNVGLTLSDDLETRLYFAAVNSESQLPGSLAKARLRADPRQANAGNRAGRQRRDFELYRLGSRSVLSLDDAALELTFGFSYKDLWHPIFQVIEQRSEDYTAGIRFTHSRALGRFENQWIMGVVTSWNELDEDRFMNVAGARGARTADSRQQSRNLVAYAQDQFTLTSRWTLVTGAVWSQADRRYGDHYLANGDQGLDESYDKFSPKIGVVFKPTDSWSMFANISDSFEAPSFGELSGGPGVTPLDAQTARTIEIGSRGRAGAATWDIAAYSSTVDDELLSLNTPSGEPMGTVNSSRTIHRGAEFGLDLRLGGSVLWRSSYLWNDFRFDHHAAYGNNRLPGIPEHFYRGALSWEPVSGYVLSVTGEWSPGAYAIDMANTWFADSYAIAGMKFTRDRGQGLSWFIEARNLTDRTYAATTGVIADARGQDAAQFLPGDGRSVYAGIAWRN